jgi:hypothetical protein
VDVDAPSGLGSNAQMDAIDTLIAARIGKPSGIVSGEVPVWNGSGWDRSSVTKIGTGSLSGYPWHYSDLVLTAALQDGDIAVGQNLKKLAAVTGTPSGAKFLRDDGSWSLPAGNTTLRKTTAKTVNNTTSETDLLNSEITIGANVIGASGFVRFTALGDWKNNSGSTQLFPRFKLKLGSTVLLDTGAGAAGTWADAAVRLGWRIVAEIQNLGATNSQQVFLTLMAAGSGVNAGNAGFATGEGTYAVNTMNQVTAVGWNTGAVDTTASQALVLSVILPTANTLTECKLYGAIVEVF